MHPTPCKMHQLHTKPRIIHEHAVPLLIIVKITFGAIASHSGWTYDALVTKLGCEVEARNPVPHWAPGAEGAIGATGYPIRVAGFVFGGCTVGLEEGKVAG